MVDRTNPDKKWDWYELGGRWEGMLKLKDDRKHRGRRGRPGLQRMDPDYKAPEAGYVDQCRKGDIDVEAMRYEAGAKAAEEYGHFARVTEGLPAPATWPEMQKLHSRPATDEEKNKARRTAFLASRTNTMLSIPMLYFMAAGGHTQLFFGG